MQIPRLALPARNDAFSGTRYETRIRELLEDPECTVFDEPDALLIYSPIAGALDVIKLHLLAGAGASRLLARIPRARLIVAEVPDDPPFATMRAILVANGYREEGRIADFVADGIALSILTRRA